MVKKISIVETETMIGHSILYPDFYKYKLKCTDYEDTNLICNLCIDKNEILEIGTYYGHTTQNIAMMNPDSHIITVCVSKELNQHCNLAVQEAELLSAGDIGNVITSKNVIKVIDFSDKFFDENCLCYDAILIDGDHSKEQVKKDTENAFKYINKDGIIIWHDVYNKDNSCNKCANEPDFNDVREYLETLDRTIYKIENSWIGFYKNI